MRSSSIRAVAAWAMAMVLAACGGGESNEAATQDAAHAGKARRASTTSASVPSLTAMPTVQVLSWRAHSDGVCGALKPTDPFKEYEFDVTASDSEALYASFVAAMISACPHMAEVPYVVHTRENSLQMLLGPVYIDAAKLTYTTSEIEWGEKITQEVNGSPYGSVSCPPGYEPENAALFNDINRGTQSVFWAHKVGCTLNPRKLLSKKNLGVPEQCGVLDPINQATGNEYKVETDFAALTPMGLSLVRTYNSDATAATGMFGAHWTTPFDRRLVTIPKRFGYLEALRPDGKQIDFVYQANVDGTWITSSDVRDTLQQTPAGSAVPTGWRYVSAPHDETETYDASGRLVSVTNRAGLTVRYTYEGGRLVRVTDPFGRSIGFAYGPNGHVSQVTDPMGREYGFGYDGKGNLTSVTYPGGKVKRYVYDEASLTGGASLPHALTGVIDEAGQRVAHISYNGRGRATGSELAGGAGKGTIRYEDDADGNISRATVQVGTTDPTVHDVQVVHGKAKVTGSTAPCWSTGTATQKVERPYEGTTGSTVDFNGVKTTVTFDTERKNEISRTEAVGTAVQRTVTTEWHPRWRLPTRIVEPGRTTELSYDAAGNLIGQTVKDAATGRERSWTFTHNANGQVLTIDGPRTDLADVTTLGYDAKGNLASVKNALGQETRITSHDDMGRILSMTDPNGLVTRFEHDLRGRLAKQIVGAEETVYAYNDAGLLSGVSLPTGLGFTLEYDAAHRLKAITDSEGAKLRHTLDVAGNPEKTEVLDAAGKVARSHTRRFDAMNRLAQAIGAYGDTTTYGYDGNSNLTSIKNPLGHKLDLGIDALNRVKSLTDARNGVQTLVQDASDQLNRVVDANGNASDFDVNALGDVAAVTLPAEDGRIDGAVYDNAGNLTSKVDFRGVVSTYTYDALNRLKTLSATDATGATTIRFFYDEGPNGIGRLTRMEDGAGVTRWTYDAMGRPLSELRQAGGLTVGARYGWLHGGLLGSITYPSGRVVSYGYTRGQLASVKVDGATLATSMKSEPFGGVSSWTWGNGQAYRKTFDLDGRLAEYPMGAGKQTLGYDGANRLISVTDSADGALSQTFMYDELDRVTGYFGPGGSGAFTSQRYEYDANGNRTKHWVFNRAYAYTYLPGTNTLSTVEGPQTLAWNFLDQSTATDGLSRFAFDAFMRPKAVTAGGVTTEYLVDGHGKRVTKSSAGGTTHFVYGLVGELLAETDGAGKTTMEYLWLPTGDEVSQPIGVAKGERGAVNYVFSDQLRTPRMVASASGAVLWRWISPPFGDAAPQVKAGGFPINLRFAGQYFDAESGLHYNRHRYFDPRTGRYTQSDPIGLAGGINTYAYVGGNPLSYADPEGLLFFELTTIAAAKRNTTLDDAVREGALTRMVTLPAVGIGLLPSAVGLVASPALCVAPEVALTELTLEELKAIYGPRGVELFRQLFKDSSRNPGLKRRELEAYREIARRAIEKYERSGNERGIATQSERIQIIERFLK